MRIPSGDLAPARRRRHRRRGPLAAVLAVVLLAAAAGAYVLRRDDGAAPAARPSACATTGPVAAPAAPRLPAPRTVRLRLLNGTPRDGLARVVGAELSRRGFVVTLTANAPKPLAGHSVVTYGPGARPAATLVAAHTIGATLLPVPSAPRGSIDLTLGTSFVRLRRGPEVAAFLAPSPAPAKACP